MSNFLTVCLSFNAIVPDILQNTVSCNTIFTKRSIFVFPIHKGLQRDVLKRIRTCANVACGVSLFASLMKKRERQFYEANYLSFKMVYFPSRIINKIIPKRSFSNTIRLYKTNNKTATKRIIIRGIRCVWWFCSIIQFLLEES